MQKQNEKEALVPHLTISPSFEDTYDNIMSIKNNFLRELVLESLGDGEDQEKVNSAFKFSTLLLLKQKKEADEFWERIKRGEATVGDLCEFCENRWHSIYCLICLEQIRKEDKVIKCSSCGFDFHEQCFKEGDNSGDVCKVCKNINN